VTYSTPSRPQPPSIEDPARGNAELDYVGVEAGDDRREADTPSGAPSEEPPDWAKRAREAYAFSTSYVDSNYRKQWEDSLRAFNNQHASDSKYNSELFRKRSNVYRPKTRSVIRKNEAASAQAFFSNLDRVSVQATNQQDQKERISAEVIKAWLQYRLTKTIPWFLTVQGALQDAQVQSCCVAHVHWVFRSKRARSGDLEVLEDRPCVDLLPIENLRIDPSAHWTDPVNTSPYLIHLIPMYVCDVKERMNKPDPKGRTWIAYDEQELANAIEAPDDSTRMARQRVSEDPSQQQRPISDYQVIWIHRHIHRWNGQDWTFYTLNSQKLLTEPEPLNEVVFHGKRPYVMGTAILETHKPMPSSLPSLVKGLQDETNEIANQRLDNIKFVLNKRWLVKRGRNVDLASLVRNVPGGITMADDPEADIKEVNWPDVTQSAYQEQDRINVDFDELAGNFSPSSVLTNRNLNETVGGMEMLENPSNVMTEYLLKTFVETFVQEVLRHLVLLCQHYETDNTILALCGKKSELFQKSGLDKVTDELINRELTITVNVGMGATDPVKKLARFVYGVHSYGAIAKIGAPGINLQEVAKEIFGLSGYQDGDRFFLGQDPDKIKMQQTIMQLMQMVQQLKQEKKNKDGANEAKIITARESNATKLAIEDKKQHHEKVMTLADHISSLALGEQAAQHKVAQNEQQINAQQQAQAADIAAKAKQGAQSGRK